MLWRRLMSRILRSPAIDMASPRKRHYGIKYFIRKPVIGKQVLFLYLLHFYIWISKNLYYYFLAQTMSCFFYRINNTALVVYSIYWNKIVLALWSGGQVWWINPFLCRYMCVYVEKSLLVGEERMQNQCGWSGTSLRCVHDTYWPSSRAYKGV